MYKINYKGMNYMRKKCSICGAEINFMSEYNLRKGAKDKICFECYQHVATAIKGEQKSVDILHKRYKSGISKTVTDYIDKIDKDSSIKVNAPENKDTFYDLVGNTINPEKQDNASIKHSARHSTIYIIKMTKEKAAKANNCKDYY